MSVTQNIINTLNSVSEELRSLTLNAVFDRSLLDEKKKNSISCIKSEVSQASNTLNNVDVFKYEQVELLDSVVNECISSLHEIHSNMKQDLIQQEAEDDYAELSAQMRYLHEQIERIKNN